MYIHKLILTLMLEVPVSEIVPKSFKDNEKVGAWELTPEEDEQIYNYSVYMGLIDSKDPIQNYNLMVTSKAFGMAGITLSGKKISFYVEHVSTPEDDWLFINTKGADGKDSTDMYAGDIIHDPEQATFFKYLSCIYSKYHQEKIEKY